MNSQILSKRLAQVAAFVPKYARLADIGSDHAYLPIYLAANKSINYAVAGEIAQGPLKAASKQIKRYGYTNEIIPRLADGLMAIQPEDRIDTVVIAGMGGILTTTILTKGKEEGRLTKEQRLILQPNNHEQSVRHWLATQHYKIYEEQIVEEHGKFYEIIAAYYKTDCHYTKKEIYFGPVLIQQKTLAFKKKWQKELQTKQKVLSNLQNARTAQKSKIEEVQQQIAWIKEVLK